MYFKQITHDATGCISYMVGCLSKSCTSVVDPQQDIQIYLDIAREKGMEITHVIESHVHADHLSGARKLAQATGARLYHHETSPVEFAHERFGEGDQLEVGNAHIKVIHTPGHTPESVSLLVQDRSRAREPYFVLTGDTLFVGNAGRPDFFGEENVKDLAGQLYESIFTKLLRLEDYIEIYPAHFSGSACGAGLSPKPVSTIGFEKRFNPALTARSREEFINIVTANLPQRPEDWETIVGRNLHQEI